MTISREASMDARHTDPNRDATYRVAPGVEWVVNACDVLVRQPGNGISRLAYPEAALWDLVSRAQSSSRIHRIMQHVAGLEPDAARAMVERTLESWAERGLVVAREAHG
jgi:hypothetical protein